MPDLSACVITTERLNLVPCNQEHLDGLSALNSDPEVMRYITGRPQTRAETQSMIERIQERWAKYGYSWWTFIERPSAQIVGAGCIQNLRKHGDVPDPACPMEIGWRIRRDRWRRGLATEGAIAMAQFAFGRLEAQSLYAVCEPDNQASIGVMVKLGMHSRGLEEWYGHSVATYEMSLEQWLLRTTWAWR